MGIEIPTDNLLYLFCNDSLHSITSRRSL